MSFFVLVLHNVRIKPVRSVLTAAAVAMGVGAAITIGIVTHSLRETAIQVLQVGQADFTISQEGVTDLLDSAIDEQELALIRETPGVAAVTAADDAATIVALVFGVVIVTNTMLLTFTERTREFGILRSIGWSRRRMVAMVVGETLVISLAGAVLGVALSFVAVEILQETGSLRGVLDPDYTAGVFWRALATAVGIGFLGAQYPAARAAFLPPLEALRRE